MVSRLGWWVQYTDEVFADADLFPDRVIYVAEEGDVGHIVRLTGDPDWFDVFWERTGLEGTCHVSEFKWIASPETGKSTLNTNTAEL